MGNKVKCIVCGERMDFEEDFQHRDITGHASYIPDFDNENDDEEKII